MTGAAKKLARRLGANVAGFPEWGVFPYEFAVSSPGNVARSLYAQTSTQLNGATDGRLRVKACTILEEDTTVAADCDCR